jgi:hypothetical protein
MPQTMPATSRSVSSARPRFPLHIRGCRIALIAGALLLGVEGVAGVASARTAVAKPKAHELRYAGRATDGATVTFLVAPDAKRIDSYTFKQVIGRSRNHQSCVFVGNGTIGVWKGVPITAHKFSYTLGTALAFRGTVTDARRIKGTFQFLTPAAGKTPACTTGKVNWSVRLVD